MKIHSRQAGRFIGAFTMIEMLVVFAIIAIIAGLVVAGAGHALVKARLSRAQSDLSRLAAAIDAFKLKRGGYPQDNPLDPAHSPLFYELTGTVVSNDASGTPILYRSPVTGDVLTTNYIATIYNGTTIGFEYTSTDQSQVPSFTGGSDTSYMGRVVTAGITNTLFGCSVPGPVEINTVDQRQITPFYYVSRNPTNNQAGFDLWIDVKAGGHVYRISNWSRDPVPIQ